MVLDPTATAVQTNMRTERPVSNVGGGDTARVRNTRQETGETSRTSPDVVAKISAAGLEASRAVTQPARPADQGAAEETVRESERREPPARQEQEVRMRTEQQRKSIDLMA